jgi:hypothetical protein
MAGNRHKTVVPEMRERLQTNRSGKLTTTQWLDIVMQPLATLLVFFIPVSVILLPRLALLVTRGWWLLLVLFILAAVIVAFRAFRYARAPVYFARFHAHNETPPFWMFWKPLILHDDDGTPVRFGKRLSPRPLIDRDRAYIGYYLRDHNEHVLLSIAPADHPDAEKWQPDRFFEARAARRGQK